MTSIFAPQPSPMQLPAPPAPTQEASDVSDIARRRNELERKRQGRSSLRLDGGASNTSETGMQPGTGLGVIRS